LYNNVLENFWLVNSNIKADKLSNNRGLVIEGESITYTFQLNTIMKIFETRIKRSNILNNSIGDSSNLTPLEIYIIDAEKITVRDNKFYAPINLNGEFSSTIELKNNNYKKGIDLTKINLFDKNLIVSWGDLEGVLINLHDNYDSSVNIENEYKSESIYLQNTKTIYNIYTSLKNSGNRKDANKCYSWLKNYEGKRLQYLYQENGGFDNFLQWKLNSLMHFYTDHGTSPTKAISISIYIIVLFGIFYFFFPSEWDTKSKTQLVTDFKVFIKKNEHGYFKPFLILLKGFLLSLINALMLSLNAFVTLGFGTIPTTGLARYVCIIQGFIGWFLLSIFTVALINQVLF